MDGTEKTIKQRLIDRFEAAREKIGPDWRKQLAEMDPLYRTIKGGDMMTNIAGHATGRRIGVDKVEMVVLALEKIVETLTVEEHESIV